MIDQLQEMKDKVSVIPFQTSCCITGKMSIFVSRIQPGLRPLKKIYQLLLLSALLGMVGCESGQNGGVLSVEEMVPIVKDLQIAYAGVDATIQKPEDRPPKYEEMNTLILAKHQMDKETFFDSFSFYQENPALMDSIFKKCGRRDQPRHSRFR